MASTSDSDTDHRDPSSLPDSTFVFQRDLDGFCSSTLQKLIAIPDDHKKKNWYNPHPYYRRPGKGHNHDFCDSCNEGGGLLCCDICPQSFHLQCHFPPIEYVDEIPGGTWNCRKCEYNKNTPNELSRARPTMNNKAGPSKITPTGSNDRNQRAQQRAARKHSTPDKNNDNNNDEGPPAEINTTFTSLIKKGLGSNPEIFELPESLGVKVNLPGEDKIPTTGRSGRKSYIPKKRSDGGKNRRSPEEHLCTFCFKLMKKDVKLSCDFCPSSYHIDCIEPALTSTPLSTWMCPLHPSTLIDAKLWRGGLSERLKLYNDYVFQPVNEHVIKVDFLRNAHKMRYRPYSRNISLPPANTAQVPGAVAECYKNPLPKHPSDVDIQQAITLAHREAWLEYTKTYVVPDERKPTPGEQELFLSSVCKFQVEAAKKILELEKKREDPEKENDPNRDYQESTEFCDSGSEDETQPQRVGPDAVYKSVNGANDTSNVSLTNGISSPEATSVTVLANSFVTDGVVGTKLNKRVKSIIFEDDASEQHKNAVSTIENMDQLLFVVQSELDKLGERKETANSANLGGGDFEINTDHKAKRCKLDHNHYNRPSGDTNLDSNTLQDITRLQDLLEKMTPESINLLALKQLMDMENQAKKSSKSTTEMQTVSQGAGPSIQQVPDKDQHTTETWDDSDSDELSLTPEVVEFTQDAVVDIDTLSNSPETIRRMIGEGAFFDPPTVPPPAPEEDDGRCFFGQLTPMFDPKCRSILLSPVIITKSVFTVGTDISSDLCLANYGACHFVSGSHGIIVYDAMTHHLQFHNSSHYGTVVDCVLYGQDRDKDKVDPAKLSTQIDEIRRLHNQRKSVMEPPKPIYVEYPSSCDVEDDGLPGESGATNQQPNAISICHCEGWPKAQLCLDTPARINNGTILQFGCFKFGYTFMRGLSAPPKTSGAKQLFKPHSATPSCSNRNSTSASSRPAVRKSGASKTIGIASTPSTSNDARFYDPSITDDKSTASLPNSNHKS